MKIVELFAWKFRNIEKRKFTFDSSIVVITGPNGIGKTNILEAISLLVPGRGLRQAASGEVGRDGAEDWAVSALIENGDDLLRYGSGIKSTSSGRMRRVYMCQDQYVHQKNKWDYAFPVVWVTPQMDHLFSANATQRRQFLDRLVTSIYPWYGREVNFYSRAMSQRNKLLQTRPNEAVWLDALEKAMAKHSVAIAAARNEVVSWLNVYGQQTQRFPKVAIELNCDISRMLASKPAIEVEDWLFDCLKQSRVGDAYRGRSSYGVHKGDFSLFYSQKKLPASKASTGQQKICLVGLLLAHARLIESNRHISPILLLDEPLIHLDQEHRSALMDYVQQAKSSVFLTGTDEGLFEPLKEKAQFIALS